MQISGSGVLQFSLEGWFIINATEHRWRDETISPGVRSGGHRVDVGIPLPFGCLAFQTHPQINRRLVFTVFPRQVSNY